MRMAEKGLRSKQGWVRGVKRTLGEETFQCNELDRKPRGRKAQQIYCTRTTRNLRQLRLLDLQEFGVAQFGEPRRFFQFGVAPGHVSAAPITASVRCLKRAEQAELISRPPFLYSFRNPEFTQTRSLTIPPPSAS